jgi:hypothetical protein
MGASDQKDINRKSKYFNNPWEQVRKRTSTGMPNNLIVHGSK